MAAQLTSPDKAEPKEKKGENKIPHLAGKQLSYCTGNRLGTLKANLVIHIFKY